MIYGIGKYKDRDKYLKESVNVTQNMRELVQELLQLTEKENSMVKCKKEYVNLTNLINEIAYELKYFIVKTIFDKHENIKYKMNSKENSVEFVVEF